MKRKLFYFVRHGESILNEKGIRQSSEGSLSENGKRQAKLTGDRMSTRDIDIIIASPYERTKETAEIVSHCFPEPKKIEYTSLLAERRNPSEIIGKSVDDLEVRKIVDLIDKSYHSDDFRFSDEENFLDLKQRAKDLLEYLSNRPEKSFLIITHGIFLRMIIAYILNGERLTASVYNTISFMNTANNAGITVCECKIYHKHWFSPKLVTEWNLLVWNDYARAPHLRNRTI